MPTENRAKKTPGAGHGWPAFFTQSGDTGYLNSAHAPVQPPAGERRLEAKEWCEPLTVR